MKAELKNSLARWLLIGAAPALLAAATNPRTLVADARIEQPNIAAPASCVRVDSTSVATTFIGITQVLPSDVPLATCRVEALGTSQRARWYLWNPDSLLPRSNTLVLRSYAAPAGGGQFPTSLPSTVNLTFDPPLVFTAVSGVAETLGTSSAVDVFSFSGGEAYKFSPAVPGLPAFEFTTGDLGTRALLSGGSAVAFSACRGADSLLDLRVAQCVMVADTVSSSLGDELQVLQAFRVPEPTDVRWVELAFHSRVSGGAGPGSVSIIDPRGATIPLVPLPGVVMASGVMNPSAIEPTPAWAPVTLSPPAQSLVAAWAGPAEPTLCVALGDVDGDGDLDLVRGNDSQGATLYLNIGDTFAPTPAWTGPSEITRSVALGDVDGDGDLDLVCGNYNNQGTTLYLNTGGTFALTPAWMGPAEHTISVALGDVDGDGDLDLVHGNGGGGTTLYLGTGGTFALTPAWTGPAEVTTSVALGDVDADGDLDLVCGNFFQGSTLYLNTGGTFALTPAWTGPTELTSVALGDVDRDGDLDLVCGIIDQGATLYLNISGVFGTAPAWVGPAENTSSVALGDMDWDGDLDLVRGNHAQGATLYLNTGDTFATAPSWTGPAEPTTSVALGDVDGDGDLDLVRGNLGESSTLYRSSFASATAATALLPNHTYWLVASASSPWRLGERKARPAGESADFMNGIGPLYAWNSRTDSAWKLVRSQSLAFRLIGIPSAVAASRAPNGSVGALKP